MIFTLCVGATENIEINKNFVYQRADLRSFLYHLGGKVLVCDCCSGPLSCWAVFLQSLFLEIFDVYDSDENLDENFEMAAPADPEFSTWSSDDDLAFNAECSRRLARNADLAASGRQGSRKRPDQLIADGLTPSEHVDAALGLTHPFVENSASTVSVNLALSAPFSCPEKLTA